VQHKPAPNVSDVSWPGLAAPSTTCRRLYQKVPDEAISLARRLSRPRRSVMPTRPGTHAFPRQRPTTVGSAEIARRNVPLVSWPGSARPPTTCRRLYQTVPDEAVILRCRLSRSHHSVMPTKPATRAFLRQRPRTMGSVEVAPCNVPQVSWPGSARPSTTCRRLYQKVPDEAVSPVSPKPVTPSRHADEGRHPRLPMTDQRHGGLPRARHHDNKRATPRPNSPPRPSAGAPPRAPGPIQQPCPCHDV
jgi:hypothetical protein